MVVCSCNEENHIAFKTTGNQLPLLNLVERVEVDQWRIQNPANVTVFDFDFGTQNLRKGCRGILTLRL